MKSMFGNAFQAMGRTTVPIMRGVPMQKPAQPVPQVPQPVRTQQPPKGFASPAYPGRSPFSGSCPVCR